MSLSLLIFFGILACYTGILLKRCLESSSALQTYPDIGQAAFGVAGRLMIAVSLITSTNLCNVLVYTFCFVLVQSSQK